MLFYVKENEQNTFEIQDDWRKKSEHFLKSEMSCERNFIRCLLPMQ